MEEEKIQEILKDPNTWCWDGVTLPEDDPYSEEFHKWEEERIKMIKKLLEEKQ